MEELVKRPVVRKHIDSEWMSKMSAKEYRAWEEAERQTMTICKYPNHEHDAKLQEQIMFKEMEYKLRKEQIEKERKIIRDGADGLIVSKINGLPKHEGRDVCLGGDLVTYEMAGSPSVSGAVLTASTKTNKNGRIYNPKLFDLKDQYNTEWKSGTFNHPDVVRWDKYEKHVKKYGI